MGLSYVLIILILTSFHKNALAEEDDVEEIGLCPKSHPYAFRNGEGCCLNGGSLTQRTDTSCNGDDISCDTNSCEDRWSCTVCRSDGCWGKATIRIKNMSPEYDGSYSFSQAPCCLENYYQEANRPIFNGEGDSEGKCIWWHRQYRHWWVGPCDNIGLNAGFAYIREDISCPAQCQTEPDSDGDYYCSSDAPITWRRGGSDEQLPDVKLQIVDRAAVASAGGSETAETTSFVGINAVIQDRTRYKQSCRFRYRNGKFVCVKKNGTPLE